MLQAIRIVTLSVVDLDASTRAYGDWLGFKGVDRGRVPATVAAAWDAPAIVGSPYTLLQSPSGAEVYLRLIERPSTPGYRPLATHGWNANEILVQDPVDLERRLREPGSPFTVIGPAAPLDSNREIVAMQASGPDGEVNYFTRIPASGGTFIKTPAEAAVDRTFIVVLGGPQMSTLTAFYRERLGQAVSEAFLSRVSVLNAALGLPDAHRIPLALMPLSPAFVIELDEYPPTTRPRPRREGDLPPGIAMVSVVTPQLDVNALPWRAAPTVRSEAPYFGRRAGVLVGAAGEWLELIETPP